MKRLKFLNISNEVAASSNMEMVEMMGIYGRDGRWRLDSGDG